MNRTRAVFFIVVAICLGILAYALAGQAGHSETLFQLYVATSVFACGVVLLDFTGLLSHEAGPGGHDFGTFADHGGGAAHAGALGGHDLGGHGLGAHDAGGQPQGDAGPGPSAAGPAHGANGHDAAPLSGHQHAPAPADNPAPILSVLTYLRLAVYFCLGFGPVGWVALATGRTPLASLVFAVPAGVAALFLARAFFRFQRQDTGAVAPEAELVGERATVVIPLTDQVMGKVRVEAGMNVEELYARAADAGRAFERGESVRIVRVTDECVQVR